MFHIDHRNYYIYYISFMIYIDETVVNPLKFLKSYTELNYDKV